MLRFAVDEDFNNRIVRGLLRLLPILDIARVQDANLIGSLDPAILEWAAAENRILLTHDASIMSKDAYARVESGKPMPGVFEAAQEIPIGEAIADLILIATCSFDAEYEGQYVTFRCVDPWMTRPDSLPAVSHSTIMKSSLCGWFAMRGGVSLLPLLDAAERIAGLMPAVCDRFFRSVNPALTLDFQPAFLELGLPQNLTAIGIVDPLGLRQIVRNSLS